MNRFAYTTFCDDVRTEVNGKISMMGIYHGALYLPEFPATLAKLCIITSITSPFERPLKNASVIGSIDGEEIFRIDMQEDQLAAAVVPGIDVPETHFVQAIGVASPITFERPCKITLSVVADGETLYAKGIHVLRPPKELQFQW